MSAITITQHRTQSAQDAWTRLSRALDAVDEAKRDRSHAGDDARLYDAMVEARLAKVAVLNNVYERTLMGV